MFVYAKRVSFEKREERLSKQKDFFINDGKSNKMLSDKKDIIQTMLYYFYPKKKDFQKWFLLLIGFFTGIFLSNEEITIFSGFKNFLKCFFIIDFLIYQARYLWNDIRGLEEDKIQGKSDRLPVKQLGEKRATLIAYIIIVIRLIVAYLFINWFGGDMKHPLNINLVLLIIISILYEIARTKKWNTAIFLLVSLGYPIRFFSGLWTAYPNIWNEKIFIGEKLVPQIILLLLFFAYMCMGEFSAVLPWAHEIMILKRKSKMISKSHFDYLFDCLKHRYEVALCKKSFYPLREKGKLLDLWNISYVLGMVSLTLISLILKLSKPLILIEILIFYCTVKMCIAEHKQIVTYTVLSFALVMGKSLFFIYRGLFPYVYVCIHQCGFILLYFFLRYLFTPDYDFFVACKKIIKKTKSKM
ncbi:MAG: hypothetical protein ACLTC0_07055 [Eisenbergiella massiliensis]|uniref:hypothetical protein n=1 Tax=Eisenbergiella massiliensis TaxID=1720294 RepID=UPI003993BC84